MSSPGTGAPAPLPPLGPGRPVSPIAIEGGASGATDRLATRRVEVDDATLARLRDVCAEVLDDPAVTAEASRDWWPLAMIWALDGQVPVRAHVVARPTSAAEVAAVLRVCHDAHVPVTAAGGRSGVCGASIPVHGGVVLDLTALAGVVDVDDASLTAEVLPGTFGDHLEAELRERHGLTLGHWPQSIALSTVGGWVACRGAGQLSNRYGKIEDMVVGLEVALADGRLIRTGGAPRAAVGPDLTQLFVGSEGTLGIVTSATLRLRPAPVAERRAAYGFTTWDDGMEACRRILRRGATPAVLRLYDEIESARSHDTELNVLLVLDEGDPAIVDAAMAVTAEECAGAERLDDALVEGWMGHRNEVSALESLVRNRFVVDTMEISAPWGALPAIYRETVGALRAVDGVLAASAHQSHAYVDGACLYFTFAGRPDDPDQREAFYRTCWDVGTRAVLDHGGSLSHHHGIGLHRARFVADALGDALDVIAATKAALDPHGILNPGKLGLPDPFGDPGWP